MRAPLRRSPSHAHRAHPWFHTLATLFLLLGVAAPQLSVAAPAAAAEPIALVTAVVGEDGSTLDLLARSGLRGAVVAATGSGNTHPGVLKAAESLMSGGVPVVLASRCPSGSVSATYAFPGGGATWARAGAILAGTLTPIKARIALALGLGGGLDPDELRALFVG